MLVKRAENVVLNKLNNELLLFNMSNRKACILNDTSQKIWECIKEEKNCEEVVKYIAELYSKDCEEVRKPVLSVLDTLKKDYFIVEVI